MRENIVLIGFMGTGKSTVGRELANELGWSFLDTDVEIETINQRSISEIFAAQGEKGFRSEERHFVHSLADRKNCVISTGGGTILDEENRKNLTQIGFIIALKASLDRVLERVGAQGGRPLLEKPHDEIEELWKSRQPAYEQADYIVDTEGRSIEEVKAEIICWLRRQGGAENENN